MSTGPRSRAGRRADTLRRLATDVDAWVATAGGDAPYLVPLSYLWEEGGTLLISTAATNPTARNLRANGRVRLTFGPTRDVVLIEGRAEEAELSPELGDRFAARTGFDPASHRTTRSSASTRS